jgi:Spy/CpxP family protein refolding chaperone
MEDKTLNRPATEPGKDAPAHSTGFARWAVIGALGLVAVGGIGVATAVSQDMMGPRFEQAAWGWGGGDGPRGGGWHGPRHGGPGFGGGFGGPGRIFSELDLTDEQEDKIFAIMDNVRSEARPLMREFRGTREDLAELLGAATIDRAAVEALRADRVAKADEASKKLTEALVSAAEVLTPEQRAKAVEMLEEGPRGRGGRW